MTIHNAKETLPEHTRPVIALMQYHNGNKATIIANYVPRFTTISDTIESGGDDSCDEYCEDKDEYYLLEGWYEVIRNWGDYEQVYACEGEVIQWREIPEWQSDADVVGN